MKKDNITKDLIERVAKRVGLSMDRYDQDWFVMMVTANDVSRLISCYDSFVNPEDKSVLMWFIIKAYDYYLRDCIHNKQVPDPTLEKQLIKYLSEDWAEHWDTVRYWSIFDHGDGVPVDESDGFEVTPLMRRIWKEHNK